MNDNDNEDSEDIEFSGTVNRLTNIVQEQYRKTLSKAIQENYSNCLEYGTDTLPSSSYVEKWTELLEEKAIKSSIIAQLYRQEMLKFMKQIKEATKNGELLSRAMNICLTLPSASSTTLEKSTQTDKEQRPFLSDKDISFLKEIRRSQNKRSRRVDEPVVLEKAIKLETPPVEILDIFDEPYVSEDNLELHLSAMFNDQTSPVLNPKIQEPSDNDYDPELKQLLLAIDENNRLIKTRSAEEKVLPDKSPVNQMLVEGTRQELMKSIWPCKLYHHRKEFQKNFLKFSEKHFRNSDLIKQRFLELFGEDSDDDDIVAFSPSHNMDSEMILSSSKKRVAAMVVQHLMEPFKKGLVGDKATFKVMAQDFTECIIANDMYPSFMEVKGVIDGYFCDEQDDSKIDINALLQ